MTTATTETPPADRVDWATPWELFNPLDAEYHFDTDVCADALNHKCDHYFTIEDDAFDQHWRGMCWMNPPYGKQISDWVKYAYETAERGIGTVVSLLPAYTDTAWWHKYCMRAEVRFIRGRVTFILPDYRKSSARFPNAVVVFYKGNVGEFKLGSTITL